jgi:hypothetical protein
MILWAQELGEFIELGGPGSGRYPAGSGGNEAPTNEQIHAKREAMKLPDTREGYKTARPGNGQTLLGRTTVKL